MTWRELAAAARVGCRRRIRAMAEGLDDLVNENREPIVRWGHEIHGAAAEIEVAKVLGLEWTGEDDDRFKASDVGVLLQVRHTDREHGSLIVRPHDVDDEVFVLVTGTPPRLRVVGWIRARDAKRSAWLRNPQGRRPAYFAPQSALRSPHELVPPLQEQLF